MLDFLKKLLDEGLEAFIKYASGGDTGVYYINGSESLPPPPPGRRKSRRSSCLKQTSRLPVKLLSFTTCGWWFTSLKNSRTPA